MPWGPDGLGDGDAQRQVVRVLPGRVDPEGRQVVVDLLRRLRPKG